VARHWSSFDYDTTNREFLALPGRDRAAPKYAKGEEGRWIVKDYGDGLMMIKPSNRTQGRCLFFTVREIEGHEELIALLAYKKESQGAPARVLDTARERMRRARGE
jgi:phage-related protein